MTHNNLLHCAGNIDLVPIPPFILDYKIVRAVMYDHFKFFPSFLAAQPRLISASYYYERRISALSIAKKTHYLGLLSYAIMYRATRTIPILLKRGANIYQIGVSVDESNPIPDPNTGKLIKTYEYHEVIPISLMYTYLMQSDPRSTKLLQQIVELLVSYNYNMVTPYKLRNHTLASTGEIRSSGIHVYENFWSHWDMAVKLLPSSLGEKINDIKKAICKDTSVKHADPLIDETSAASNNEEDEDLASLDDALNEASTEHLTEQSDSVADVEEILNNKVAIDPLPQLEQEVEEIASKAEPVSEASSVELSEISEEAKSIVVNVAGNVASEISAAPVVDNYDQKIADAVIPVHADVVAPSDMDSKLSVEEIIITKTN